MEEVEMLEDQLSRIDAVLFDLRQSLKKYPEDNGLKLAIDGLETKQMNILFELHNRRCGDTL